MISVQTLKMNLLLVREELKFEKLFFTLLGLWDFLGHFSIVSDLIEFVNILQYCLVFLVPKYTK